MLKDIYKDFLTYANTVENWRDMSITELANKYIETNDDAFFYCLMIKYWYLIPVLHKRNSYLNLQLEDYVDILLDGLNLGFQYKGWLDSKQEVVFGQADKVFNRTIHTVVLRMYKYVNQDKRKINYCDYLSLDSVEDSDFLLVNVSETQYQKNKDLLNITYLVNDLLTKERFLEAIIVDQICWGDTFRLENGEYRFKKNALIKSIRKVDSKDFSNKYNITEDEFNNKFSNIINCSNATFVTKVNKAYKILQNERDIKLCF